MEKLFKNAKGITLIALIITIIILLILAGISIATLTGQNGILKKAEQSGINTTIAKEKEQIKIAYNSAMITKIVEDREIEISDLKKELDKQMADAVVQEGEIDEMVISFIETNNQYILTKQGEIEGPMNGKDAIQEEQLLEQLERKVATLENRTMMKNLGNRVENVKIALGVWTTIVTITVEEDGYADIYGAFNIQNNDSISYKGIGLYHNGIFIAGNGKGGSGRITLDNANCTREIKKGDRIELKVAQWITSEALIHWATIQINYFPINQVVEYGNIEEISKTERIVNLEKKVKQLENKMDLRKISEQVQNISIPTGTLTKVTTVTVPEDCYADIFGKIKMENGDRSDYKGIHLYKNGELLAVHGKGGNGDLITESISYVEELKKGDVIDLYLDQFTGVTRNVTEAQLRIHYMPITEEVEEIMNNQSTKDKIEELQTKITNLENRTTMKTLEKRCSNVIVETSVGVKLLEIIVPEDCYADIYGFYDISNNDNMSYKGISIHRNGEEIVAKGKGGSGGITADDISTMMELKKGDVMILYASQYTGRNQTVQNSMFIINYLKK